MTATPQPRPARAPAPVAGAPPTRRRAATVTALVDGLGAVADSHLHVRIDLEGRVGAALLRRALRALSQVIPELGATFERGFWGARWVLRQDPTWEIREVADVDEAQALRLERALFGLPFQPTGTLPLRAWLLHGPEHDVLLLRVSHLLADGGGTKNLCYRLAEACRELARDPDWRPPAHPVPNVIFRLARARAGCGLRGAWAEAVDVFRSEKKRPRLWVDTRDAPPRSPLSPLLEGLEGEGTPPAPAGEPTTDFVLLHLPASRVERLRERYRGQGITLNDLALAAMTRAMDRCFGGEDRAGHHVTLLVTSDLRRYEDPPRHDVSNFSNLRPLVTGVLPCPSVPENLRRVVHATRLWKAGATGLFATRLLLLMLVGLPHGIFRWMVGGVLQRVLLRDRGITALTNIGPLVAHRLDFGHGPCRHARVLAPVARGDGLLITALTGCRGALDLSIAYKTPWQDRAALERLRDVFDEELSLLATAGSGGESGPAGGGD